MRQLVDTRGRRMRFAVAAGRLLMMREEADGWRAYGCVGCTGISVGAGSTGLRGGLSEADVVAFLRRHPQPHINIIACWEGPGRYPIYVPFMLERIEGGVSAVDMYCRAPDRSEWMRATVTLRRWPPPYSRTPAAAPT